MPEPPPAEPQWYVPALAQMRERLGAAVAVALLAAASKATGVVVASGSGGPPSVTLTFGTLDNALAIHATLAKMREVVACHDAAAARVIAPDRSTECPLDAVYHPSQAPPG